jgi:hypothetical protein
MAGLGRIWRRRSLGTRKVSRSERLSALKAELGDLDRVRNIAKLLALSMQFRASQGCRKFRMERRICSWPYMAKAASIHGPR